MIGLKKKIRDNKYLKYSLFVSNYMNSGFRGTDTSERVFKILRIIIVFLLIFYVFSNIFSLSIVLNIGIAFFLSYSFNYYFHFNYATFSVFYLRKEKLEKMQYFSFMEEILSQAEKNPRGILAIGAYGSISRGKMHSRSDLDVTLLRDKGVVNALFAIIFMERMRRIANKRDIPFDTAVADSMTFLKNKYRKDEPPVIIFDKEQIIKNNYDKILSINDAKAINVF